MGIIVRKSQADKTLAGGVIGVGRRFNPRAGLAQSSARAVQSGAHGSLSPSGCDCSNAASFDII